MHGSSRKASIITLQLKNNLFFEGTLRQTGRQTGDLFANFKMKSELEKCLVQPIHLKTRLWIIKLVAKVKKVDNCQRLSP